MEGDRSGIWVRRDLQGRTVAVVRAAEDGHDAYYSFVLGRWIDLRHPNREIGVSPEWRRVAPLGVDVDPAGL